MALGFAQDAALVVCDRGYLKPQKAWRTSLSRQTTCRVVQVEGDVVVPVETASPKHEVGARTLRPKLYRVWDAYIVPLSLGRCAAQPSISLRTSHFDLTDVPSLVRSLKVNQAVPPVRRFQGGTDQAWARLGTSSTSRSLTTPRTAACQRPGRHRT